MGQRITVVLPIEAPDAAVSATELAPGIADLRGTALGVVDNGLWRSMAAIVAGLERAARAGGVVAIDRTPFDHLAPDFAEQQAGLWPFGQRVAGAVAGLGN